MLGVAEGLLVWAVCCPSVKCLIGGPCAGSG